MQEKAVHSMIGLAKYILLFLILLLVSTMIFGGVHLVYLWVLQLTSPEPIYFALDINDVFDIYGKILIVVVGFELIESIKVILFSGGIPFRNILQIAVIAISNKMITLDLHKTDFNALFGLAAIMASLGVAYYFFNMKEVAQEVHE